MRCSVVVPLVAALPLLPGVDVADDDLIMAFHARAQLRGELAQATAQNGDDWDIAGGDNTEPENADLYFRELRFGVKGEYKGAVGYQFTLEADHEGLRNNQQSAVQFATATLWYTWGQGPWQHRISGGKDSAGVLAAERVSSAKLLLPSPMPNALFAAPKVTALSYELQWQTWRGLMMVGNTEHDNRDLWFAARLETSFLDAWRIARSESFLGQPGFGLLLGGDLQQQINRGDQAGDPLDGQTTLSGDLLLHANRLTALGMLTLADGGDQAVGLQMVAAAQAGYAIPGAGCTWELALRLALIDLDSDDGAEEPLVYQGEYGGSGTQIEAGVNVYFDGHSSKIQLAATHWTAERGSGDATVLRAQYQLDF